MAYYGSRMHQKAREMRLLTHKERMEKKAAKKRNILEKRKEGATSGLVSFFRALRSVRDSFGKEDDGE